VQAITDARPFWGLPGQVAGRWHHAIADGVATVTMNGHPAYEVGRHPRHGGVYMQSCWCLWAGFALETPGVDPFMEDEYLDGDVRDQTDEIKRYNILVGGGTILT